MNYENFDQIYYDHIIKMKDEKSKYVELLKTTQGLRILCDSEELLMTGVRRQYISSSDFIQMLKSKSMLDIAMNVNSATRPIEKLLQSKFLKYATLLNAITKFIEVYTLVENSPLLVNVLSSAELTRTNLRKFDRIIKRLEDKLLDRNVSTFLDYVQAHYDFSARRLLNEEEQRDYSQVSKLVEVVQLVFRFEHLNKLQRAMMQKLLFANDFSQTRISILTKIVENNLSDQYDFETLKNLLTKDDNKKKLKLNL